MVLGWRPHDIETAYLPFACGVGVQVGTSDLVFMKRFGLEPRQAEVTAFPFEPEKIREAARAKGGERAAKEMMLGRAWLSEVNSGVFRTWEDLKFIRDNWNGPIVLKGIQRVSVCIASSFRPGSSLMHYHFEKWVMAYLCSCSRRTQRKRSNRASTELLFRTTVCLFLLCVACVKSDVGIRTRRSPGRRCDRFFGRTRQYHALAQSPRRPKVWKANRPLRLGDPHGQRRHQGPRDGCSRCLESVLVILHRLEPLTCARC